MPYRCKQECGFRPGSPQCLIYQVKKLAEEVAELQEAISHYFWCSANYESSTFDWLEQIRKEWRDVCTMIEGIREYHGEFLERGEEDESVA